MEQFRIRPDGFKEIRKRILFKLIPLALIAAFGGVAISYFTGNGQESDVNIFPIVIPLVLVLVAFGVYIGVKRQKQIFESYRLTLDSNGITRAQHNTPTILISKADVREITKNASGSFTITGPSSLDVIGVPSQIGDYEKLEQRLADIKQITKVSSEPFLQKIPGLVSILTIGLMAAVYISKDKIIVGVCGTILLVTLGYSFFVIQRSKNVDRSTQKGMWMIIVVIATIAGLMYLKLNAQQ